MSSARILSWNILHGGGTRREKILKEIEASGADIVALMEFRHGKHGDKLIDGLKRQGIQHIYAPQTESARQNTVVLASRFPMRCEIFPVSDGHPARAITATIEVAPSLSLNVLAAHLPQKQAQVPYFTSMLELPGKWLTGYSLIIGDLNCGIPFEDSQTKTFYATQWFQQLLHKGWHDAWRERHPNVREFTWVSTGKGNGFRYDHALVSSLTDDIISCVEYDHSVRENKTSDHSSLHVVLDW